MSKQTKAQRLADELYAVPENGADPDLIQESAALLLRQDELLEQALAIMTGEYHLYRGLCPDAVAGWNSTDPDCPACAVITAIRALKGKQ